MSDYDSTQESLPIPETYGPDAPSGFPGNVSVEQQAKVGMLRNELKAAGCTERLDDASMVSICCLLLTRRFRT